MKSTGQRNRNKFSNRGYGWIAALLVVLAYVVLMQLALAWRSPGTAVAVMVAILAAALIFRSRSLAGRWSLAAAAGALLVLLTAFPEQVPLGWLIYIPPVAVNLILLFVFGRTLARGREPLVARFARLERGHVLPSELARHTRLLTILWTAFFALMAIAALGLSIFAPLSTWSLWTNVVNPLLVVALFLLEYVYRRIRYRRYRHASPLAMLDAVRASRRKPADSHAPRDELPLFPLHRPEDVAVWRRGRSLAAAELEEKAAAIARALPDRRYVLNLCRDRYRFMAGFAAALLCGRVTLLPPGHGGGALDDVRGRYRDLCCIADHDEIPHGVEVVDMDAARAPAGFERRRLAFRPDQVAAVVFTSGSTGRPVAHAKTWGSLVRGANALGEQLGLSREARPQVMGNVPAQHMFGLESTVMLPAQWGGAVDAACPLLPAETVAGMAALPAPRWLMTTPVHLRALVQEDACGADAIVCSTMPLDEELAQAVESRFGCALLEVYGSTESGAVATRRTARVRPWSLLPGVELSVENGVARVQGAHVDPPTPLGDRIRVIDSRCFELRGRDADVIKVAGKRASLQELNRRLLDLPGVLDGAFYFPQSGKLAIVRPVAFAVAPGKSAAELIVGLRKILDPVFIPRPLFLVDALPRPGGGKIPLQALADLLKDMRASPSAHKEDPS